MILLHGIPYEQWVHLNYAGRHAVAPDEWPLPDHHRDTNPETTMSTVLAPIVVTPEVANETQQEASIANAAARDLETLTVTTPADIEIASVLLGDVKRELNRLVARKEEITKPLNAALKSVRDLFRPAEQAYSSAEQILKRKIGGAQLAIQEANRLAQAATQAALAAGNAREAAIVSGTIVSTEAPKGVSFRERFTFRIVNAALLPRDFLMPDERRIREYVQTHGLAANIPGVQVERDVGVIARTK